MIPNFKIGDTVFHASTTRVIKSFPCPDCLGTKQWEVLTPAGTSLKVACQRCSAHYSHLPSLTYPIFGPSVSKLTIGSIRTDSAAEPSERISYMCLETGVGSGNIYSESRLFATEKDAEIMAEIIASKANAAQGYATITPGGFTLNNLSFQDSHIAGLNEEKRKAARLRNALLEMVEDGNWKDASDPVAYLLSNIEMFLGWYNTEPEEETK